MLRRFDVNAVLQPSRVQRPYRLEAEIAPGKVLTPEEGGNKVHVPEGI